MKEIERLVVFAILMETDDGIVGKSPAYIRKKFQQAMNLPNPEQLLDWINIEKFKEWCENWK